jgi:hypothetical protein
VRGLPYRSFADFDLGVQYLQLLGVRYYAATTPEANAKAAANPALHQVATVPDLDKAPPNGWTIYEVSDAETVAPLSFEPVVATDLHEAPNWECEGRPEPPPDTSASPTSVRGVPGRALVPAALTDRSPTTDPSWGRCRCSSA